MIALCAASWVVLAAATDPCAGDPDARAPDPRCAEALDGRVPAEAPTSVKAVRAALAVPRVATQAVFWPVVKSSDMIEEHQVFPWMRAVLTTDDGLVGVRPVLAYSTSFLPTGGLRLFYRRIPGPSEADAQFQTAGPAIMIGDLSLRGPRWLGLSVEGSFNRRDDRLFAGIGALSNSDLVAAGHAQARYGSDNWAVIARWQRPLKRWLAITILSDIQRRDYHAESVNGGPSVGAVFGLPPDGCAAQGLGTGCVDPTELPGFSRGVRLAHAGGGVAFEARDRNDRDGSGIGLRIDGAIAQGLAGDPSRHGMISGESVVALGGHDRQFLLRGRAAMVGRLGDAPIPFDELVIPTGAAGMRGFPEGRFRGASGLVTTAEYRWYISAYLDASLFTDVGTVAGPRFGGLDSSRWFPSFGLGIRLYEPQGAYWEAAALNGVQLAYAPDNGFRVLFALAPF